jgi:hypothetical protein
MREKFIDKKRGDKKLSACCYLIFDKFLKKNQK